MKHDSQILFLVTALLVLLGAPAVRAQRAGAPAQTAAGVGWEQQPQMPDMQQQAPVDPILQLNLSAEQREKIRTIREQTKAERAANNERVRETNQALEAALDADNPDEGVVEQRVRDVAAAQSAAMRMRILTEVRIRRVLTLEQLGVLRTLRQQARDSRRNRMLDNSNGQRQQENGSRIQNQRNGIAPLFPKRALQRRQQP
ncbi:MAG: Heavy-metal resistance [Pyrinomonadaceae bacterium]|jgi:Spy/CpxP family protein refolding chaperone|nr:Heavy-metal resistance [Pyrinomonadaceae bacterium]